MKCWVSVVSKEHALIGIAGGFMQACHGKAAPLKRMKAGDWFMFYCPATTMSGGVKVQKFLGLGRVKNDDTYQFEMNPEFCPFRRDIEFIAGAESLESAPISTLKTLSIKSKLRFGFFELPGTDAAVILESMGLVSDALFNNSILQR